MIDVFASFVKEFKNHLPVDGVFFDFEMYHAQDQGGSITDLMDFSDCAWRTYCSYRPEKHLPQCKRFKQRITYLKQHKKFKNYFMVLQKAAENIGKKSYKPLFLNLCLLRMPPLCPSHSIIAASWQD